MLIVSPVNTFAYHHYVDFAYESIFIWYLDFIKIFIIENSNIVYLSSSYNIFKGRRRRFWSESENLRYPWGFHNLQKNRPRSAVVRKTPLFSVGKSPNTTNFEESPNTTPSKWVVFGVSQPELKGFFRQLETVFRFFLRIMDTPWVP